MLRRSQTCWQRMLGGMLVIAGVVGLMVGCATPRERYETLSVFFDGVPNPAAVKTERAEDGKLVPVLARTVTQHAPFRDNKCDACHRGSNGELEDFSAAYKKCVTCHKAVTGEHALMHGPVVREDCKWCHAPHESAEPALLKASPIVVCTQCHNKELLGPKPAEHMDGKTSCLECHSGHGGAARYFLKPTGVVGEANEGSELKAPAVEHAQRPFGSGFGEAQVTRAAEHGTPAERGTEGTQGMDQGGGVP